jgi:tRNA-dihydrouridine synthase 3
VSREEARAFFADVVAMAPMAKGGNLPYRRLCRTFGAIRTCSEMVLSDKFVKGGDRPLVRRHPTETDFGVQLAGKRPEVMAAAASLAVEGGAAFIDLNFGCPIDLIVKRGAGAALLRRPKLLGEIVAAVRESVEVPLSVKLRLGYDTNSLNVLDLARRVQDVGADAVGIHGRTRAQRYRLSANWDLIDQAARTVDIPVLGNGDLLTPWDLERRRRQTSVRSFLVARGALIKPWIFREFSEGRPWNPTSAERWAVLRTFLDFALEHFGDDAKGIARAKTFFLWHCGFWHRHRPWTEEDFQTQMPDSLIQARSPGVTGAADLELLASDQEKDHEVIWQRVLDRDFPAD